jgi:hypothetical protein
MRYYYYVYVPRIPVLEFGSYSFPSSRRGSRPKQWTGFMNKGIPIDKEEWRIQEINK